MRNLIRDMWGFTITFTFIAIIAMLFIIRGDKIGFSEEDFPMDIPVYVTISEHWESLLVIPLSAFAGGIAGLIFGKNKYKMAMIPSITGILLGVLLLRLSLKFSVIEETKLSVMFVTLSLIIFGLSLVSGIKQKG